MAGFSDWFGSNWWNNTINSTPITTGFNKFSSPTTGSGLTKWGLLKQLAPTQGVGTYTNGLLRSGVGNVMNNMKSGAGSSWNWFGDNGIVPVGLAGLQVLGGLGDLWLGYQNYQLAQKAYQAQVDAANNNGRLQTQIYNDKLRNAGNTAIQLSGYNDDNAVAAVNDEVARRNLSWNNIG